MMLKPFSEDLLSAYLDDELSSEMRQVVEQQLEKSPQLREQLEGLAEVGVSVRALPRPTAPTDFQQSVLTQLTKRGSLPAAAKQSTSLWSSRRVRWIASLSSMALICLLGVMLLPEAPPKRGHLVQNEDRTAATEADRLNANAVNATGKATGDSSLGSAATPSVAMSRTRPEVESASSSESPASGEDVVRAGVTETLAADASEGPVPAVVEVTPAQLQQLITDSGRVPNVGNNISIPGDGVEGPIVVEFTVVDVMKSFNQVQVLLSRKAGAMGGGIAAFGQEEALQVRRQEPELVVIDLEMEGQEMADFLKKVPALNAVVYVEDAAEARAGAIPQTQEAQEAMEEPASAATLSANAEPVNNEFNGRSDATPAPVVAAEPQHLSNYDFQSIAQGEAGLRQQSRTAQNREMVNQGAPPLPPASGPGAQRFGFAPAPKSSNDSVADTEKPAPGAADEGRGAARARTLDAPASARALANQAENTPRSPDEPRPDWQGANRIRALLMFRQSPAPVPMPAEQE